MEEHTPMSQPKHHTAVEHLIATAEALGAVEFNQWTADGMLCRRYISPDGNIDLTVRVP